MKRLLLKRPENLIAFSLIGAAPYLGIRGVVTISCFYSCISVHLS